MASLKRILLDVEEVDNSSDSQASRFSRHSSNVSGAVIDKSSCPISLEPVVDC